MMILYVSHVLFVLTIKLHEIALLYHYQISVKSSIWESYTCHFNLIIGSFLCIIISNHQIFKALFITFKFTGTKHWFKACIFQVQLHVLLLIFYGGQEGHSPWYTLIPIRELDPSPDIHLSPTCVSRCVNPSRHLFSRRWFTRRVTSDTWNCFNM